MRVFRNAAGDSLAAPVRNLAAVIQILWKQAPIDSESRKQAGAGGEQMENYEEDEDLLGGELTEGLITLLDTPEKVNQTSGLWICWSATGN